MAKHISIIEMIYMQLSNLVADHFGCIHMHASHWKVMYMYCDRSSIKHDVMERDIHSILWK